MEPGGHSEEVLVPDSNQLIRADDAVGLSRNKRAEVQPNGPNSLARVATRVCDNPDNADNVDLIKCYIRDELDSAQGPEPEELVNVASKDLVLVADNLVKETNETNESGKDKRRNVSVVNINYNESDHGALEPGCENPLPQRPHSRPGSDESECERDVERPLRVDHPADSSAPRRGVADLQFDFSDGSGTGQIVHMKGSPPFSPSEDSGNLVSCVYTNGALNNINIDVSSFEPESPSRSSLASLASLHSMDSPNSGSDSMASVLDDHVIDLILTEEEKAARGHLEHNAKEDQVWNCHSSLESDLIVDFLDKSTNHAEARLAARRLARAEAREIRMRELERQQREAEENADKVFDLYAASDTMNRANRVGLCIASPRATSVLSTGGNNSYHSSRRSSEDSLEDSMGVRDIRHELREVEDKFRKAMIQNAQLDNEKSAASYQVELFKDRFEELEESHTQLQREHRDKCREHEQLKRLLAKMQGELEFFRLQLEERDRLIKDQGLVIVGGDCMSEGDESDEGNREVNGLENGSIGPYDSLHNHTEKKKPKKQPKRALVSVQSAELLETVGEGSLDVRLRKLGEERNELLDELRHVKLELEEERGRSRGYKNINGDGGADFEDVQREANKLLGEYKFKWQKAEQDVSTLQANVARLESQVIRYKSAAETSEKVEDELKVEKRKLQRELREAQSRVEELETSNMHLQRRLDKLKSAKSTLLKEL